MELDSLAWMESVLKAWALLMELAQMAWAQKE
jgi:hypothetical protein